MHTLSTASLTGSSQAKTLVPTPDLQVEELPLIVMKFGGTSVGSVAKILQVAKRCLAAQHSGQNVVVVVSAMSGETNKILALAEQVQTVPNKEELDTALATGEQLSASLLAMAIQSLGGKSRSFLAHQLPLLTDENFGNASLRSIITDDLRACLASGVIPVVAGFQGMTDTLRLTTLGRGGSDTTAVALAASLKAEACEIYADVDGVYTADPNLCETAQKLPSLSYDAMQVLAGLGAKVMHDRSIGLARRHNVAIHVRDSRTEAPGTWINAPGKPLDEPAIAGLTVDRAIARLLVSGNSTAGDHCMITELLGSQGIACQMVEGIRTSTNALDAAPVGTSLLLKQSDLARATAILSASPIFKNCNYQSETGMAQVSLAGYGLSSDTSILSKVCQTLSEVGITIDAIISSETRISIILCSQDAVDALCLLHDAFLKNVKIQDQNTTAKKGYPQ